MKTPPPALLLRLAFIPMEKERMSDSKPLSPGRWDGGCSCVQTPAAPRKKYKQQRHFSSAEVSNKGCYRLHHKFTLHYHLFKQSCRWTFHQHHREKVQAEMPENTMFQDPKIFLSVSQFRSHINTYYCVQSKESPTCDDHMERSQPVIEPSGQRVGGQL